MTTYRRYQSYAILVGIALVVINVPRLYLAVNAGNTGRAVFSAVFALLGVGILAVKGDLAGRHR